jgi:imidazolonepropionase-like amidohydrolase
VTTVASERPESSWLVRARHLVTGIDETVIENGALRVADGRITAILDAAETANELAQRPGPVMDYGDATVLPGLIDAHCHVTLTGDGSTYEEQVLDPDEMMSLIAASNLQRHLSRGVTTIRDNGGRNRVVFIVREAIQRGYIRGPRMLLAGRPLTHSYGHFYWCNGVADGHDQIRAAVRQLVAEGADHIKIMASGGATAGNIPYYPSYEADELRVAVQTAHGLGRLTTAHCRAAKSMDYAVDAGLDCIEHGEFLVPGDIMDFGAGVASAGVMEYDPRVTNRILRTGTFLSFTAQTGGHETLVALKEKQARTGLDAGERGRVSMLAAYFDMKLGILSALLADGMLPQIAISSDAGPYDVAFGGLQHGIGLAVQAGFSPVQAIAAATSVAAAACGIADRVGSLRPGLLADFVVVGGDASADVARLWDVRAVYQSGVLTAPVVADSGVDRAEVPVEPAGRRRPLPDC